MKTQTLVVDGLHAGYGDINVLWGIELSIELGEIVCIIGSNGAGKTTLLKTISGLVKASSGQIVYAGVNVSAATPADILGLGIAHVPEGRRLFSAMSVEDNLKMGAFLRNDNNAIAQDLQRVYDYFPRLYERRTQDAGTLSGGEQQMCAVGRGIMSAPSILMIDELSLGLAPQIVEQLSEILLRIRKSGLAILVVEQDVNAALDLADRGFVVDRGKITLSGPAEQLRNNPLVREAYLGL